MQRAFASHNELFAPWSLEMPAIRDAVSFHVVLSGTCWVQLPGADAVELQSGEVALVPHGLGHHLASTADAAAGPRVDHLPQEYITERFSILRHGGSGHLTKVMCGIVSFDDPAARELMRSLPSVLHIGANAPSAASSIHDVVRLMMQELAELKPGGETVATRLADIVVVQVIRTWITLQDDSGAGWLRALKDERIGRVIEAVHAEPGAGWTLDRFAQLAAMSRSSFSARFTELVGQAPISYLTQWRMRVAHARLLSEKTTVARLPVNLATNPKQHSAEPSHGPSASPPEQYVDVTVTPRRKSPTWEDNARACGLTACVAPRMHDRG